MDTAPAGLICSWLVSFLFIHNVGMMGWKCHILTKHFTWKRQTLTCFFQVPLKQTVHWASGYVAAGHRYKYRNGKSHSWARLFPDVGSRTEHGQTYCYCAFVDLKVYWLSLPCWGNPSIPTCILFCRNLFLVCSFLDSQPWKCENLCWNLVAILCFFFLFFFNKCCWL